MNGDIVGTIWKFGGAIKLAIYKALLAPFEFLVNHATVKYILFAIVILIAMAITIYIYKNKEEYLEVDY